MYYYGYLMLYCAG